MHHIDLGVVLRETVACNLYSNLVTRPTGAAVRGQIERMLGDIEDRSLTVIDLTHVSMIDFSCADEVIAKLVLRYCEDDPPHDAYFLFRGITDDHWDAIEAVIERHGLALVLEEAGAVRLVGAVAQDERRVWEAVCLAGPTGSSTIAGLLGRALSSDEVDGILDRLCRRRLVVKFGDEYAAVGGGQHRE
ncbi:MAG TPA: hypothetical protein VMH39_14510 [Gemmatimonadaceae bacterium]|nr:hypothetical protein [Gemmatimonadaceae bacterium]